jgi:hypothetical protein
LNIRKLVKTLLFFFVVVSVAFLVYKEFSPRSEGNATDAAVTKVIQHPYPENPCRLRKIRPQEKL